MLIGVGLYRVERILFTFNVLICLRIHSVHFLVFFPCMRVLMYALCGLGHVYHILSVVMLLS